jgi:hypothetical protein
MLSLLVFTFFIAATSSTVLARQNGRSHWFALIFFAAVGRAIKKTARLCWNEALALCLAFQQIFYQVPTLSNLVNLYSGCWYALHKALLHTNLNLGMETCSIKFM